MKKDVVLEARVAREPLVVVQRRPAAIRAGDKDAHEPVGQVITHLAQGGGSPGTGRALYEEVIAVVVVKPAE